MREREGENRPGRRDKYECQSLHLKRFLLFYILSPLFPIVRSLYSPSISFFIHKSLLFLLSPSKAKETRRGRHAKHGHEMCNTLINVGMLHRFHSSPRPPCLHEAEVHAHHLSCSSLFKPPYSIFCLPPPFRKKKKRKSW